KAYTVLTLCHPISDIAILNNRKQAIEHISKNKQLMKNSQTSFKAIAHEENLSLQPWHTKSSINEAVLKSFYYPWVKTLNANTIALETYNRGISSWNLIQGTIGAPLMQICVTKAVFNYFGRKITFKEAAQHCWNRLISPEIPLFIKFLENYSYLFQPIYAYQSA